MTVNNSYAEKLWKTQKRKEVWREFESSFYLKKCVDWTKTDWLEECGVLEDKR